MRTRHVTINSRIAYEYTEEETPIEVIESRLKARYEKVPFDGGKVMKIYDIKTDDYAEMSLYANTYEIELNFSAKVQIAYFNMGDVIFNVDIQDEVLGAVWPIANTFSELPVIMTEQYRFKKCNAIIKGVTVSKNPMYIAAPAIYPNYAPILMGHERKETEEIEDLFYTPGDSKKVKITNLVDPLAGLTTAKRRDRIISDVRKYMFVNENPYLEGLTEVLSGKKPKLGAPKKDRISIEFVELDDLEKALDVRDNVDVVYVPSIPIGSPVCAIIYGAEESKKYTPMAIKLFRQRVLEYINMKFMEAESLAKNKPSGELLKMYEATRKAIIEEV